MPIPVTCNLRRLSRFLVALGLVLAGSQHATVSARQSKGPSTSNPDNALWVTLEDRLSNWRSDGEQQYSVIAALLKKADNSEKIGFMEVEEAYLAMLRLDVLGARLAACGEVAGIDFRKRAAAADIRLTELAKQLAQQPATEGPIKRQTEKFTAAMTAAEKKLPRASKQAQRGDYDKACTARFTLTFPVRALHLWWYATRNKLHPKIKAWNLVRRQWVDELAARLTKETKIALGRAIEKEKADFEILLQQMEAAATQIAASGQFELPGTGPSAGPKVVDYFGQQWIEHQAKAFRWRAMVALQSGFGESTRIEEVDSIVSEFSKKVGPALASVVDADAQQANTEQAIPLYDEYLESLVPIVARTSGIDLLEYLVPALDRLAAKNPSLSLEVSAYRACTKDLLRWRQLTVEAYVRANSSDYVPQKAVVLASARDRDFPVLRIDGATVVRNIIPVPAAVRELGSVFLNKKIAMENLVSTREGKLAVGDYQVRSIAYVPINRDWFAPGDSSLASDLFATEDSPPMTLEARLALFQARQGDVSHAGGDITNVGLIGWTTRLLTLDPKDPALARLGPFASEPLPIQNDDLTLMFMIRPAWVANGYTFVTLIDQSKN